MPIIGGAQGTVSDLLTAALGKIGAARAGDVISPDDMQTALDGLNALLDLWNVSPETAWVIAPLDFTLVPLLSPHTIGVAGSAVGNTNPTFVVGQRPMDIEFIEVNLGGTPNVYYPVTKRLRAWYEYQPVPDLTQTFPTDFYYSPDWMDPNATGLAYGSIYFWGVPTTGYAVRLWLRSLLAQVALTDIVSAPPGYYEALKLSLAEAIADDFGQVPSSNLLARGRDARDRVFSANLRVPRIRTAGPTMPNRSIGDGGDFNYKSRSWNGNG